MDEKIVVPCGESITFSGDYARDDKGPLEIARLATNTPEINLTFRIDRNSQTLQGSGVCRAQFDLDGNPISGTCLRQTLFDAGLTHVPSCRQYTFCTPKR